MIDRKNAPYLAGLAVLSALCFAFRSFLGVSFCEQCTIDLTGVPAVVAFIVFGFDAAFAVLVAGAAIAFFSTNSLVALVKFTATLAMLLVPAAYSLLVLQVCAAMSSRQPTLSMRKYLALATTAAAAVLGAVAFIVVFIHFSELGKSSALSLLGMVPVAAVGLTGLLVALFWNREVGDDIVAGHAFTDWKTLGSLLCVALVLRAVIMLGANYLFIIPSVMAQSPEQAIFNYPPGVLIALHVFQGIIEFAGGLFVVKALKLDEGTV